jgi:DNA-binding transcriptional ArsR family regulator
MNGVYEALAHPTRRQIIALLRGRSRTAGELAEHFDIAKPTLSGHLRLLREAGLIYGERNGSWITYHLHLSLLEESLSALLDLFKIDRSRPPEPDPPPTAITTSRNERDTDVQ